MKTRIQKTTRSKAEIAVALDTINNAIALRFEIPTPNTAETDDTVLIEPKAAARMLGVSTKTLANWRSSGVPHLKYVRTGSRIRYRLHELHQFLLERSFASTSEYGSA